MCSKSRLIIDTAIIKYILVLSIFWVCTSAEIPNDQVHFNVSFPERECNASHSNIKMKEGNVMNIRVIATDDSFIKETWCQLGEKILAKPDNFTITDKIDFQINVTNSLKGQWLCPVEIRRNEGRNKTQKNCTIFVEVEQIKESMILYYVSAAVAVVVLIIIGQTFVILHFKAKANAVARNQRLSVRQTSPRNDRVRYSIMPGARSKKGRKQLENQHESRIYEVIEIPLPKSTEITPKSPRAAQSRRPPLALPSEDEEHLYEDESTLQRIFPPKPPSVDTLPKKKPQPKSERAQPVSRPDKSKSPATVACKKSRAPSAEYDYTDDLDTPVNLVLKTADRRNLKTINEVQSQILPPRVKDLPRPTPSPILKPKHSAAPIINELDDVFRKRRLDPQASNQEEVSIPHLKPAQAKLKPLVKKSSPAASSPVPVKKMGKKLPPPPIEKKTVPYTVKPNPPVVLKKSAYPPENMNSPVVLKKPVYPPENTNPPPVAKKPAYTPPENTSYPEAEYQAVSEPGDDSDDEEWTYEQLHPYHIYNI